MKAETLQALNKIQRELVVPKARYNSFAKFHYRSCEDILEAVKAILPEGACVVIEDEVIDIGDRFYVKATVRFIMGDDVIATSALAREPALKKGSDESQITGAASSYARKYALNGLFLIDDAKDVDEQDNSKAEPVKLDPHRELTNKILAAGKKDNVLPALNSMGYHKLSELHEHQFAEFWKILMGVKSDD